MPQKSVGHKVDPVVVIKGAGDLASGVAWSLHRSRLRLIMTEISQPLAVRRTVAFCEAVYQGWQCVEGVDAVLAQGMPDITQAWAKGEVPVLVDPELKCLEQIKADVLVEATLAKCNQGCRKDLAPLVIALGPGFQAGVDAHLVVETQRGHDLGRIYQQGWAQPNTRVPGEIGGLTIERILRAPAAGVFETTLELGAVVAKGQEVARVAGRPVISQAAGMLRGLIRPGIKVSPGLKVGDVDPRSKTEYLHTISDKARSLGGAVLQAIMTHYNQEGA